MRTKKGALRPRWVGFSDIWVAWEAGVGLVFPPLGSLWEVGLDFPPLARLNYPTQLSAILTGSGFVIGQPTLAE